MSHKNILLLVLGLVWMLPLNGQKILEQACIGDLGYDNGMKLIPVEHNCYLLGGTTASTAGLGQGNHSANYDMVVALVSPRGKLIWQQCIGGTDKEEFGDMVRTADGGIAIIGTANSKDGHASGTHGKMDLLVAKLDALGRFQWFKTYGGHGNDQGLAIIQTSDGGYLIGGESGSNTGDMTFHKGGLDAWVAKLDAQGEIEMQKSLGGRGNERVTLLDEIKPGRYMVVCNTTSSNGDIKDHYGAKDVWIACLSKNFDFVWTRSYGGSDFDEAHGFVRNHEGDYVFSGTTFSEDHDLDLSTNHGLGDSWLFLISPDGGLGWSQTYGSAKSEGGNGVTQTPDNGYLLVGTTNSDDQRVKNKGLYDGWVVRTDEYGRKLWHTTYGGEDFEYFYDAMAPEEGNYIALGFAESVKGDLAGTGKEIGNDMWLVRFTDPEDETDHSPANIPYMTGYAFSLNTGDPIPSNVYITDNTSLKEVSQEKGDSKTGIYNFALPEAGNYSVMITSPGYMFYGQDLDYTMLESSPEMRIDAPLAPIMPGSKLALRNIFFDIGKADLKSTSEPELNRLLKFMKLNPNVKVEISGHTDDTGNKATKKQLSLLRATRVRDWMLQHGVAGKNMTVAGYGMDRPVASNESEEGRAKNRRVEVEIKEVY